MCTNTSRADSLLYIHRAAVESLLKPEHLIVPLESALSSFSRSSGGEAKNDEQAEVIQPVRTVISVNQHKGFLAVMPGYVSDVGAMATKLVSFYPHNATHPTHQAWIMLHDPSNGSLLAVVDGDSITAQRTAVASAIATKYLASSESRVLALLGSGVQARSHYHALTAMHKYDEVRVWSRTEKNARSLANELGAVCCGSVREAVEGADVVCTLTFSTTPIVQRDWLKHNAHINAVGACRPDWSELAVEVMTSAVVYCDTREAAMKEAGDVILSKCEIYAEIGEVIGGTKEARRERLTVFKSLGMAVEDVVSAKIVYDKYCEQQKQAK